MESGLLTLQTSRDGDTAAVKCTGRLVAGGTGDFRADIKRLIAQSKVVVLDFTGLTQMDSLGLGTIVSLYVSAKSAGCELKMINLSQRVRELFHITNLSSLFEVYGDHPTKMM